MPAGVAITIHNLRLTPVIILGYSRLDYRFPLSRPTGPAFSYQGEADKQGEDAQPENKPFRLHIWFSGKKKHKLFVA